MTDTATWQVVPRVDLEFRPHRQLYNAPFAPGELGDCWRAVLASLLGYAHVTDVPHFLLDWDQNGRGEPWGDIRRARDWLRRQGLDLGFVTLDDGIDLGLHYGATVRSHRVDGLHAVVCLADEVVWDPSGDDRYTFDEVRASSNAAEVICEPYDPEPVEMIRLWLEGSA